MIFTIKIKKEKAPKAVFESIKKSAKTELFDYEAYKTISEQLLNNFSAPEGWIEVERYSIFGKFVVSSIHILYREDENEFLYYVNEPRIEDKKHLLQEVLSKLEFYETSPVKDRYLAIKNRVDAILSDFRIHLDGIEYFEFLYHVFKRTILYGKITPIMFDPNVEDISCNGYRKPIYVFHKNYTNIPTNIYFERDELDSFVVNLAQKCGK
ncbi:MAG: secretion system protein E, partial [Archaeoglobaceae archaeon]|nr:secretion system protein E [Archaeoglobaceae archaeon]MDW8014007.1 secretion system protein E [Archaeoglobaceae archaeon]